MQQAQGDPRVGLLAVGFSPPDGLARLADQLAWRSPFLADEQRVLYRRLGLPRAGLLRTYSPGTLARYARALARGQALHLPVEDTRQLGGDAVVREGVVRRLWRPATPDDRVSPRVLLAAATEEAG